MVGVVADVVIYDASRDRPLDWVYVPFEQLDPTTLYVTYRATATPAVAADAVSAAVAAALVALIGLYGIVAFEVSGHMPDFGVRVALGAGRTQLLRQIIGGALLRTTPGLLMGLLLAWASGPAFGVFLSGVSGRAPVLLAAIAAAYLVVAGLAALAPARRAAGLDPARILRSD